MTHIIDKYFVHRDGGLYFALYKGIDSRDLMPVIVYRHVYPFEVQIWTRPEAEWTPNRFREVTHAFAHEMIQIERAELQELIKRRKQERKG